MEHLFSAWHEISTRLKSAERVIWLSDFDGTLAPIVVRPELATLPEQTKRLLPGVGTLPEVFRGYYHSLSFMEELRGYPCRAENQS